MMDYPRNLRGAPMKRRIAAVVCIAAFFGLSAGSVAGYALKVHMDTKAGWADTETIVYGAYDDRCFKEEISIDWTAGDPGFEPVDCQMPEEQQEFVFYLCSGYGIDFTFAMALIQHESGCDPSAVSSSGDYGYMQVNIQNHGWLTETLGTTDYLDPYQNVRAGMFVLRKLFERYQDASMVLMAYNMGEKGARRLWDEGVFATGYTERILETQRQFGEQIGKEGRHGNNHKGN